MKLSVKPKKGNRGGARAVGQRSKFGDMETKAYGIRMPIAFKEGIKRRIYTEILPNYYKINRIK